MAKMTKFALIFFVGSLFICCNLANKQDVVGVYRCSEGGVKLNIVSDGTYLSSTIRGDTICSGNWVFYEDSWNSVNFSNWKGYKTCNICMCESDCDCTMLYDDGKIYFNPDNPSFCFKKVQVGVE